MSDGGDIELIAGLTSAQGRKGGTVSIAGGEGASAHQVRTDIMNMNSFVYFRM